MTRTYERRLSPAVKRAVEELKGLVLRDFPDASLEVARGIDDPDAVDLVATVDVEDTDQVMDLVIERVLRLQTEQGLPVDVAPVRPPHRAIEELGKPRRKIGPAINVAVTPRLEG